MAATVTLSLLADESALEKIGEISFHPTVSSVAKLNVYSGIAEPSNLSENGKAFLNWTLSPQQKFRKAAKDAAQVAKGVQQGGTDVRMLVPSHWLEVVDVKHRRGKEITRSDLERSCVKYCNVAERKNYATKVVGNELVWAESGALVDTSEGRWIFVMDLSGTLYTAPKKEGQFHHSSFLAGGPTLAAGRIIVVSGYIKSLEPHSGHYRPEQRHFEQLLMRLAMSGLDVSKIELDWEVLEHNKRKAS